MKRNWNIVHDMDKENGEPTCWSLEINHKKYGRFVWITLNQENKYDVEVDCDGFRILITCKSLTSAKRWVTMNF